MNAARRKQLEAARELIEQAQAIIQEASADESEAFENLPESLQEGDRGQAMQEAISELENAESGCDDILSAIDRAVAQ